MNKILLCNLDLLRRKFGGLSESENQAIERLRNNFIRTLDDFLYNQGNQVFFISREQGALQSARETFEEKHPLYQYILRDQVKQILQENNSSKYIIVSNKDVDFQMAVRFKVLLIVPLWIPYETRAEYYGISVDFPNQLFQFIQVLNNQNMWYSECQVDDHTIAVSLMDARYRSYAWSVTERDMMQNFENLLKEGQSRSYYKILLYHFLSGITNTDLFDDIELFGMIPSSDCSLNSDMFEFMQQVRYIKGKRLPHNTMHNDNLLIREQPKGKAHRTSNRVRAQIGPIDEFSTLCINGEFAEKISKLRRAGKLNVCVFDDYMTYGNSFNAVRNLLNHLGANKIILVSLGSFGRPFERWDYNIRGSVYSTGYEYELISQEQVQHEYNLAAKNEVAELYNIFNG